MLSSRLPLALLACLVVATAQRMAADEFVVESRVFAGDDGEPVSHGRTIFSAGYVYDLLESPHEETTIYDRRRNRFVVLDPVRKLRTETPTDDIREFTRSIQQTAQSQDDPLLQFLAAPRFTERDTDDRNVLLLSSPFLTYRITTEPAASSEAAFQYGEFAHWQAQLNVMLNPGALPPFGRLAVNELLEKRRLVPTEVELTLLPSGSRRQPVQLRATHRFQGLLLESDRRAVADINRQLATFRPVSLEEYRSQGVQTAAEPSDSKAR